MPVEPDGSARTVELLTVPVHGPVLSPVTVPGSLASLRTLNMLTIRVRIVTAEVLGTARIAFLSIFVERRITGLVVDEIIVFTPANFALPEQFVMTRYGLASAALTAAGASAATNSTFVVSSTGLTFRARFRRL